MMRRGLTPLAAGATLSFTHFLSTERKRTKKEPFSRRKRADTPFQGFRVRGAEPHREKILARHFLSTERKRTKKEPFSGPEGKGRIKGAAVNLFARRRLRLRREYAKKRAEACVEG
jgi:hypothetical protein